MKLSGGSLPTVLLLLIAAVMLIGAVQIFVESGSIVAAGIEALLAAVMVVIARIQSRRAKR